MYGGDVHLPGRVKVLIERIVSGGQSGADRGALDAALALGIGHGGYCPLGRRAEDGPIAARYQLTELSSPDYAVRTERNVVESDGTVLITEGKPTGGSALTRAMARKHRRPFLHLDLAAGPGHGDAEPASLLRNWLRTHSIRILNVAGSRESKCPGIADKVRHLVTCAVVESEDPGGQPSGDLLGLRRREQ